MFFCWGNPENHFRWHLAEWHRKSELMPRYLTLDQSMELQRHCDGCLYYYVVLANRALEADELLFPIRPKLHVPLIN